MELFAREEIRYLACSPIVGALMVGNDRMLMTITGKDTGTVGKVYTSGFEYGRGLRDMDTGIELNIGKMLCGNHVAQGQNCMPAETYHLAVAVVECKDTGIETIKIRR